MSAESVSAEKKEMTTDVSVNKSHSEIRAERMQSEQKLNTRKYWNKIKSSVRNISTATAAENEKNIHVMHGIHPGKTIQTKEVHDIIFIPHSRRFVICMEGSTFIICSKNGKMVEHYAINEKVNKLVLAQVSKIFVGYEQMGNDIYLLTPTFQLISTSQSPHAIQNLVYNEKHNEIVSFGHGIIIMWEFRYSNRYLMIHSQYDLSDLRHLDLKYPVLEATMSRNQHVYMAYDTSVVEYNFQQSCVTAHKHNLHILPITCLEFYNPTKFLITGSQDGSIKVWCRTNWAIVTVFVGHSEEVTKMCLYPFGPNFISISKDCTLRVWNLEISDEIDQVTLTEPASSVVTLCNHPRFITYKGGGISHLYRIQELYTLHSGIGCRIHRIIKVTNPLFPERTMLICRGNNVSLISPHVGTVLTTVAMDHSSSVVDVAYAPSDAKVFAVFKDGVILKCEADCNPMNQISTWSYPDHVSFNYLLVYEYVVDFTTDNWTSFQKSIVTKSVKGIHTVTTRQGNRTLLLGGRTDGYICVLNWETGAIDFEIEAHGKKGVVNMIANSMADQLISAGMDNIIKVWRLFPYDAQPLLPLMSFYCAHKPLLMCIMRDSLGVVFQEALSAIYSLVVYNLQNGHRSDHHPQSDHADSITALTSCNKLQLFATASLDTTIRIWNENNKLIKVLHLNITPHCLSFYGQRGDLLVGIREHLYKISHLSYIPDSYKYRMFCMNFLPEKSEPPFKMKSPSNFSTNMADFVKKAVQCDKALQGFIYQEDELTAEEKEKNAQQRATKENVYSVLKSREDDLKAIRDSKVKASTKRSYESLKESTERGFQKYMKKYYNVITDAVPVDDPLPKYDDERDKLESKKVKSLIPYTETKRYGPPGFFEHSRPALNKTDKSLLESGYVPNSVVVKLIWPMETRPNPPETYLYRPPMMSEAQLREIDMHNRQHQDIRQMWEDSHYETDLLNNYFLIFKQHYHYQKDLKEAYFRRFKLYARHRLDSKEDLRKSIVSRVFYMEDTKDDLKEEEAGEKNDDETEVKEDDDRDDESKSEQTEVSIQQAKIEREQAESSLSLRPSIVSDGPGVSFLSEGPGVSFVSEGPGVSFVSEGPGVSFVSDGPGMSFLSDGAAVSTASDGPVNEFKTEKDEVDFILTQQAATDVPRVSVTPVRSPIALKLSPRSSGTSYRDIALHRLSSSGVSITPERSMSLTPDDVKPMSASTEKKTPRPATVKKKQPSLPPYIQQFRGTIWFDRHIPDGNYMPTPDVSTLFYDQMYLQMSSPEPSRPSLIMRDVSTFITQTEAVNMKQVSEHDLVLEDLKNFREMLKNISLTRPKEWTPDLFLMLLARLLNESIDFSHKNHILKSILVVMSQEPHVVSEKICQAIIATLNHDPMPNCLHLEQKSYIISAIQTLGQIAWPSQSTLDFLVKNESVMAELLAQYLDGDKDVRDMVRSLLKQMGLYDPGNIIGTELDSWDTWDIENDSLRKPRLLIKCSGFLRIYLTQFQNHVSRTLEKLTQGQSIMAQIPSDRVASPRSKSSATTHNTPRSVTVSLPTSDTASVIAKASYIDALNYFVDLQSMQQAKRLGLADDRRKNTILVRQMPHASQSKALVRLGESHTECTNRKSFGIDAVAQERLNHYTPGEITGFVQKINLPMKSLYINPFPNELDELDSRFHEPILITLKSSQKLFFPDKSHVPVTLTALTG